LVGKKIFFGLKAAAKRFCFSAKTFALSAFGGVPTISKAAV
jgi:hypothetical protein